MIFNPRESTGRSRLWISRAAVKFTLIAQAGSRVLRFFFMKPERPVPVATAEWQPLLSDAR
jgi:hypothetical protein